MTFDVEEMVRVMQKKAEEKSATEKLKIPFLSYEDFIVAVKAAGVTSRNNYFELRKSHPEWPYQPSVVYKDRWKGWGEMTGNIANHKKSFLPYKEFVAAVKAAGATSQDDYYELRKSHPEWPSTPARTYKASWKSWGDLTGNIDPSAKKFLSYEDFVVAMKATGVTSRESYRSLKKLNPNWPSEPDAVYGDQWKGWVEITGNTAPKDKEFLPYQEFVAAVRAAGVTSRDNYFELRKSHPEWPSAPDRTYKNQWQRFGPAWKNE